MKKYFGAILLVILVVAMTFSLAACGEETNGDAINCKIIFADAENSVVATFQIATEYKHLDGVLNELDAKDNNLELSIIDGYITSYTYAKTVYGNAATSEYVLIFSDILDEMLTNPVWGTVLLDGITYASCAVGIAEMPIQEGATYVIAVSRF